MNDPLTHLDNEGNVRMVDVGKKADTERVAIAQALVELSHDTYVLLVQKAIPKGDVFACAKIGGIMAAKQTSALIPLCHNVPLSFVDITFQTSEYPATITIRSEVRCVANTGVEMEAIIAAQTAAAIIYDMCKAVQRDIIIRDVRLLYKNGGKSGEFRAPGF